jgi:hypothetical protein
MMIVTVGNAVDVGGESLRRSADRAPNDPTGEDDEKSDVNHSEHSEQHYPEPLGAKCGQRKQNARGRKQLGDGEEKGQPDEQPSHEERVGRHSVKVQDRTAT